MAKIKHLLREPYFVHSVIYLIIIFYAFIIDSPREILNGILTIITSRDMLITDYIEIAGIGATLINVALTSIFAVAILIISKVKANGSIIMSMWLMTGFAFFGKNFINIWPIIFGGWLYSKSQKEPFLNYSLMTLLATSLSPTVSLLALNDSLPLPIAIATGILVGILIGLVMAPVTTNSIRSHAGYNLYNAGFAAGIIAIAMTSVLRAFGVVVEPVLIWSFDSSIPLTILLCIIFAFLICVGLISGENNKENMKGIYTHSGRLVTDYYYFYKETAYINMGTLGLFALAVVWLLGGYVNGPVIGGICAIVGFAAFGKHLKNITPVMIGSSLGGLLYTGGYFTEPVMLAILFCTTLAPIAGVFGWRLGMLAGFLHVSIVLNVTPLHGGLNLYNNGLAGGLVCMFYIPIISSFKKGHVN